MAKGRGKPKSRRRGQGTALDPRLKAVGDSAYVVEGVKGVDGRRGSPTAEAMSKDPRMKIWLDRLAWHLNEIEHRGKLPIDPKEEVKLLKYGYRFIFGNPNGEDAKRLAIGNEKLPYVPAVRVPAKQKAS